MKKVISLLLLLVILLSIFTGCTSDPTGSSSDVPPSSAPSSDVPTSSNPGQTPLELSMPMHGESLLSTLSPCGYVNQDGVLHFSPEYLAYYKNNWPSNQQDTQNIKNGTPTVKAIYSDHAQSAYILMCDGTVQVACAFHLDSVKFSNGEPAVIGDTYYKESQTITNADALAVARSGDLNSIMGAVFVYAFSANNGATISAPSGFDFSLPAKNEQIVYSGRLTLHIDGTVSVSNSKVGSNMNDSPDTWTDIVQVSSSGGLDFGLKADGTLKISPNGVGTSFPVPEQYQHHVVRLFSCAYRLVLQQSDGTIYVQGAINREAETLGQYPLMDQIVCFGSHGERDILVGVDTTGKVHCLSHKVEDLPKDSAAAWACTLTDVKTVWND